MEAISRSCLPAAAARTKRQRKATCCGVLGAASHRTTCSRSSAAKLTSGLILAMRTHISYWPQYVYLFMIHTTSCTQVAPRPIVWLRLRPLFLLGKSLICRVSGVLEQVVQPSQG